jgi:hypothetical protein
MKKIIKKKKRSVAKYIQIIYIIGLLVLFYFLKFPLPFIAGMGLVFVLIIFLKGKLYRKIESFMDKKFPFLVSLNPTIRKIIIILIFILFWVLLKQIIFMGFNLAGIDLQDIMIESLNQSAIGSGSSSSGGPGA